ncbi:MAG: GTP-binding protein, partial [Planctomycetota bacterium]
IFDTQMFDEEKAATTPGWRSDWSKKVSESDEYGFSSFVYNSRKPFHPERLQQLIWGEQLKEIARIKGFVWLASRHDMAGFWSLAGRIHSVAAFSPWYVVLDHDLWPWEDRPMIDRLKGLWEAPYGDRRQEIVLIGRNIDETEIGHLLDDALVTEDEFQAGPSAWEEFADPLPSWQAEDAAIEYDDEAERLAREEELSEWQEFRD